LSKPTGFEVADSAHFVPVHHIQCGEVEVLDLKVKWGSGGRITCCFTDTKKDMPC